MSATISPITMPKLGLSMTEGTVAAWHVDPGSQVSAGDVIADIETSKITNVCEAPFSGTLRRIVAEPGETLPVGALIGVVAGDDVADEEIADFIEEYNANFVPGEADEDAGGPNIDTLTVKGKAIRVGSLSRDLDETPVVLLHGFGGDLNNWLLLMDRFGATRPVYAIELLGHGQSDKTVEEGSVAVLADWAAETIDALGLNSFHLVGHSLGAAVAIKVANRAPDRTKSLSLICPAALPGGTLNTDYLEGFIDARRSRDLKPVVSLLFANQSLVTRDLLEELIRFKRLDGVPDALAAIKDQLLRPETEADLSREMSDLICKTLVVASKSDKIVGAPDASLFGEGTRIEWLDSPSHMPHLEEAPHLFEIIEAFLT